MGSQCSVFSKWRFDVKIVHNGLGINPLVAANNLFPGLAYNEFAFRKISEFGMEVEIEEIFQGGSLVSEKYPGRGKTDPVTMEYGAVLEIHDYNWFNTIADFSANGGSGQTIDVCNDFKSTVFIKQKNGDGTVYHEHSLRNSWVHKWMVGDLDNESSDKAVRTMDVVYDFVRTVAVSP